MKRSTFILLFVIAAVFLAGFISSKDPFFQIRKNFTIFSEVISEVNELYVVDVDPERSIRRGINAMLETLDPYTVLIDESQTQDIDMMTTGSYAGVGIEVGARGGELVVIAPVDGYSAQRQGVRAGDVLVKVNGISVSGMSPDDLNAQMRGQIGTEVELVVRRFGMDEELEFELERERIEIRNIEWYGFADKENGIAYILLSRFTQNAAREVRRAISSMREEGELNGLILDLRNNPGGLLMEAVYVSDIFLPEGLPVVNTRGRADQTRQKYETQSEAYFKDKPLVVLQNSGSASSSEIVAGALQDHDRAVILGEQSFGKGLVQIVRPISYGMALKITTSKYFIPSGRYIQSVDYSGHEEAADLGDVFTTAAGREVVQRNGIEPDVKHERRAENMLEIALIRENHYFFFANEFVAETDEMPEPGVDDDALFEAFRTYLENEGFEYRSRAQRRFAELEEQVKEDYGPDSRSYAGLDQLRESLEQEREREMDQSRETILRELYLELTGRYDNGKSRFEMAAQIDPIVDEAKILIRDPERYRSILSP